jgi:hypothetical protein
MHERYFYLADVLSVVLAFYRPRLWYLPLIVQASSFLSYVPFLFLGAHGAFVDRRLLATLMLSALLITGYCLLSDVRGAVLLPAEPEPAPEPAEEPEARTPAPQPRAENDEPAPAPVH